MKLMENSKRGEIVKRPIYLLILTPSRHCCFCYIISDCIWQGLLSSGPVCNYLICIFMNVYANLKNDGKIMEK